MLRDEWGMYDNERAPQLRADDRARRIRSDAAAGTVGARVAAAQARPGRARLRHLPRSSCSSPSGRARRSTSERSGTGRTIYSPTPSASALRPAGPFTVTWDTSRARRRPAVRVPSQAAAEGHRQDAAAARRRQSARTRRVPAHPLRRPGLARGRDRRSGAGTADRRGARRARRLLRRARRRA